MNWLCRSFRRALSLDLSIKVADSFSIGLLESRNTITSIYALFVPINDHKRTSYISNRTAHWHCFNWILVFAEHKKHRVYVESIGAVWFLLLLFLFSMPCFGVHFLLYATKENLPCSALSFFAIKVLFIDVGCERLEVFCMKWLLYHQ